MRKHQSYLLSNHNTLSRQSTSSGVRTCRPLGVTTSIEEEALLPQDIPDSHFHQEPYHCGL
jgi:hypothetical protein